MPDPVVELARRDFSLPYLYPIQRLVIANVLEGVCQLVVLPTGGGKSLCFQLPARLLEGLTVVVVPLLALMADQLQGLRARGLPAGALRGGQSGEEREALLRRAGPGVPPGERLRLLYVTPEGLASPDILGRLRAAGVGHLVVDEAHCLAEWGHSFRPAYLELARVLPALSPRTVSAFTATATPEVLAEVERVLFAGRPHHRVLGNPDRPNLHYEVRPVLSRLRAVERLLREAALPALVFGRSREGVRALAAALARRRPGGQILFYHAGLSAAERQAVEAWFLRSRDGMLVATSAYGLGVDKPDVRTVIHAAGAVLHRGLPPGVGAGRPRRAARPGRPAAHPRGRDLPRRPGGAGAGTLPADPGVRAGETPYSRSSGASPATPGTASTGAGLGAGCRRRFLLAALGVGQEEPPAAGGGPLAAPGDGPPAAGAACSGCDVCDGTAAGRPEGEAEMLRLVRRRRRQYTRREVEQILAGRPCYEGVRKGLDRLPEFGLLAGWEPEDIAEGLDSMVESGRLTVLARGFWKDRVTAGGNFPWKPSSSESSRSTGAPAGA